MPVDASAKGKQFPPFEYEVGKEKIREFAQAVGSGTVTAAGGDSATVETVAEQSGKQIIKNARAELRTT